MWRKFLKVDCAEKAVLGPVGLHGFCDQYIRGLVSVEIIVLDHARERSGI
jgi:hypothetical protein